VGAYESDFQVQVDMSIGNSSPYAEPKIGRTLEQARKEQGLSLKQVEEATKIRAGYLKELERENFDVLPAVYVQGSLKTYANFLHLNGEALVQELKRRQAPRQEPPEPAYVESRKDAFLDRPPIELGGAAVVGSQEAIEDEKGAGSTLIPAGINRYLYLISGAFLVLALTAVALALVLAGDRQPAVSQVREPLISQAPPEASPASSEKVEHAPQPQRKDEEQGADDGSDRSQLDAEDEGADLTAQTGQVDSRPAQDPRYATATPSASPTAETAPATAEPFDTSTPPTTEPDTASTPPTTETPAQRSATGVPADSSVNQSDRAPPTNARGTRETGNAPTGGARNTSPRSRDGDDFDVEIVPGSDNVIRITGDPSGD
jgi:transcriptional regulator with XRE-family HTH domain